MQQNHGISKSGADIELENEFMSDDYTLPPIDIYDSRNDTGEFTPLSAQYSNHREEQLIKAITSVSGETVSNTSYDLNSFLLTVEHELTMILWPSTPSKFSLPKESYNIAANRQHLLLVLQKCMNMGNMTAAPPSLLKLSTILANDDYMLSNSTDIAIAKQYSDIKFEQMS